MPFFVNAMREMTTKIEGLIEKDRKKEEAIENEKKKVRILLTSSSGVHSKLTVSLSAHRHRRRWRADMAMLAMEEVILMAWSSMAQTWVGGWAMVATATKCSCGTAVVVYGSNGAASRSCIALLD